MANPTISIGSTGTAVKLAQRQLVDRGYGPLNADGIFGAQTRTRVRRYQTDRKDDQFLKLAVDGIVGPKTWGRLDPATIKKGAKGDAVKLLQSHLNWYSPPIGGLAVDGDFGPATEASVKEFQDAWGTLAVDGIVGRLTWTALWS